MRKFMLALALVLIPAGVRAADTPALPRIPVTGGLSTVEAPPDWHLEESGTDLTATFSENPGADGALVIAAPNPSVADIAAHNRLAAAALLAAFGNGSAVREEDGERDGVPRHTVWFEFEAGGAKFLGWSRTIAFDGGAVQGMAMATEGRFAVWAETAEPILDSYAPDADMIRENIELLGEVGGKIIAGYEKAAGKAD